MQSLLSNNEYKFCHVLQQQDTHLERTELMGRPC